MIDTVTSALPSDRNLATLRNWRSASPWLLCFFLPVSNLVFLAGGPYDWDLALLWTLPVWLCILADRFGPSAVADKTIALPDWPFTAGLYALFALQLGNIALMLDLAGQLNWNSPSEFAVAATNVAAMRIMTGTNSCCSGIAVAHELIHRRRRHQRWMGRILLWSVLYDHFFIEHLRGHHRNAATDKDLATARFGESYSDFWKRTSVGQFVHAWRLEGQRLRAVSPIGRLWQNRVLHGIAVESLLLTLIGLQFGGVALAMFIYQAVVAVRLLEAVNYFQHWGLSAGRSRSDRMTAWATDSWFSCHVFLGLSRHADHHNTASRPFHRLQNRRGGPRLRYGYFVMAIWVKLRNASYCAYASRELVSSEIDDKVSTVDADTDVRVPPNPTRQLTTETRS